MMVLEFVDVLVGLLERENVEWEIYWESGRSGSFRIERESLERAQRKFFSGIGLRVGVGDRAGFSYITGLTHSRNELERFVKRTIKLAKVGNVPFRGFPTPRRVRKIEGLYDSRIEEIPFEEAHGMAEEFADEMRAKKEVLGSQYTLSGSLGLGLLHYGLLNSNGIELSDRSTVIALSAYTVMKDGKTGSGYYSQSYRTLDGWEEREGILEKALSLAEDSYRAVRGEPYDGMVFLEPHAVDSVLSILLENFHGDSVYFGRSRFSRPGVEIGPDFLSIYDDATVPGGIASYPFDGEGTPGQRTALVEEGIVRSFLLDHTYASFLGLESTGNAARDFRTPPHIFSSNLVVEPGDYSLEEFEGVVISRVFGEDTANPVSGDFSLTVELGYIVKDGERIPIKDNMFAGNVFELLKKVEALGKDVERIGSSYLPGVLTAGRLV